MSEELVTIFDNTVSSLNDIGSGYGISDKFFDRDMLASDTYDQTINLGGLTATRYYPAKSTLKLNQVDSSMIVYRSGVGKLSTSKYGICFTNTSLNAKNINFYPKYVEHGRGIEGTDADYDYDGFGFVQWGSKWYCIVNEVRQSYSRITNLYVNPTSISKTVDVYQSFDISCKGWYYKETWSLCSWSTTEGTVSDSIFFNDYRSFLAIGGYYSSALQNSNNVFTTARKITESYTFGDYVFKVNVTVNDFKEDYLELRQINDNFNIYSGQQVGTDFLNAFAIYRIRKNDYKTIEEVKYSSLEIDNLQQKIFYDGDTVFKLVYYIDSQTFTKEITDSTKIHSLAAGTKKFENLIHTTEYYIGDQIDLSTIDIKSKGALTYDDGTQISLNDIEYITAPSATCSLIAEGESSIRITILTPTEFTMSYVLPTTYFGNLTYEWDCQIAEYSKITKVELVDAKTLFSPNETIDFGDNAKIKCYNADGELIVTIKRQVFYKYITEANINYGKKITEENGYFVKKQWALQSKVGNNIITHYFDIQFPISLKLNITNVKQLYYFKKNVEFEDFDYSGLSVSMIIWDGSKEQETQITDYVISHSQISTTFDEKTYPVTVTANYLDIEKSSIFNIEMIRIKPVRITSTGEDASYWNNGTDTFHIPSNITFSIYYNNAPTTPVILTDDIKNTFQYYYDSNYSNRIEENSIITTSNSSIYYIYTDENGDQVKGSYNITFKEDNIDGVALQDDIEIVLGNDLNDYFDKFNLTITYQSGNIKTNFTNFVFVNEDTLMEAPTKVEIKIGNSTFDILSSKITFVKPEIENITLDISNFPVSYNNGVDSISASNIKGTVTYVNSKYKQIINTYKANTIVNDNDFKLQSSVIGDNYVYNGTQVLNVDMESKITKDVELTLTVRNVFNNTKTSTTPILLTIIEITEIIGISLVDTFTDYHVGESFLNENDTTEIMIFYKNAEGNQEKMRLKLNSGFSALNITPVKGTQFYNTDKERTVKITSATNYNVSCEYSISVSANYIYSEQQTHNLRVIQYSGEYKVDDNLILNDPWLIVDGAETYVENGIRKFVNGKSFGNVEIYGYLSNVGDTGTSAHVILFNDYIQPVTGESNITVQFPCYVNGNADYINNCHFGHLFGNNNAKNRLFLSGNPNVINCDWHSGAVNTDKIDGDTINENGNFTYFEDTSYCYYGQTDNKIIGYDIISNDKMVVLKSRSDKEPTIYYRTNGLIQAIDGSGNSQVGLSSETLYEESYPLVQGNIGAGAISNKSIINFNGDTLFISSDKQIDGLDVVGIIGDSQRYANTRSYYIDPLLKNEDLENAQFFTNNKYLFVILKDYLLVTYFSALDSDTKQYEWWKLDIPNVTSMIEINDIIYYGNSEGKFFQLSNGAYQDISKIFVNEGAIITLSEPNNTIQTTNAIINQLKEENSYYFKNVSSQNVDSECMYYKVYSLNNSNGANVDLKITGDYLEVVGFDAYGKTNYDLIKKLLYNLNENAIYYLNHYEGESDITGDNNFLLDIYYKPLKLKLVDEFIMNKGTCFYLCDYETGEIIKDLQSKIYRATLCRKLDGEYLIGNIDKENAQFKIYDTKGDELDLIRYADQSTFKMFRAEIKEYNNVKAYYITAPITMGNLLYNKTIWGWTLTNDTSIPSSLEICQATNEIDFDNMAKIVSLNKTDYEYNLSNLNYKNLDFDKYVVPHTYTFYRPVSVPFICFGFRNNDNDNAVLCTMQVIYTMPSGTIGKN